MYKVYAIISEDGKILSINSSAWVSGEAPWRQIDEGEGIRYFHAQSAYLPSPTYTDDGICRWRYIDGECVLRSEDEIEEERQSRPSSYDEREDMEAALDMLGVSR